MNLSKQQIRKIVYEFRNNLSYEDYHKKSSIIYNKIINSKWYLEADTIISYVSTNNEPDTFTLINKAFSDGKKVAVPKIINKEMEFYYINSLDELEKGYFGILEPVNINNKCVPENVCPLMLVPGVAFDLNNNRTGYGGGFYDKYLSRHTVHTIAICFKEQIFEQIPIDEYDIKMNKVITD
ncbi:MAG: 5-formyltetrahydrofolate cyclo-ligase [Lachnospiraceae bacterium]|nr:5-formyltetrahydrofolate cyclo-ligase [Lachnospiraceae bacterium]